MCNLIPVTRSINLYYLLLSVSVGKLDSRGFKFLACLHITKDSVSTLTFLNQIYTKHLCRGITVTNLSESSLKKGRLLLAMVS